MRINVHRQNPHFAKLRTISIVLHFILVTIGLEKITHATEDAKLTRPNVIFVLADDLGIGDIEPTNPQCKIKTPNLNRLAQALPFSMRTHRVLFAPPLVMDCLPDGTTGDHGWLGVF